MNIKLVSFFLLLAFGIHSHAFGQQDSQDLQISGISTNPKYGYTEKTAIKVGSVANIYKFLKMLNGPQGQVVQYKREGSCCMFKSKNGLFGKGLLDVFTVWYEGGQEVQLYFNGYDYKNPQCPKGFVF